MTDKAVRTRKRPTSKIDIPSPAPASSCNRFHEKLKLVIEYVDPESLTPPARKLRKHSPRQIAQIIASVRRFGFIDPVLVDANKKIICGYGRWIAACELGMVEIPVIDASHLSDEQRRLYAIAENQLGAMSEWDLDELKLEFGELLEFNLDLNIELTGFTTCEIDQIVAEPAEQESPVEPEVVVEEVPVTRLGDLWALGDHRLFCGDAQEKASYQQLMGNELAQMAFCDPPFNTPMRMISGKGRAKHRDFAMAAGEMVKGQFTSFLTTIFMNMVACSMDGAIHFQCMDWRHSVEMQEAGERAYTELKNLIVWNKGSGGMGTFYRSQHELIFAWKTGTAKHINNFGLGENGRYRTNVWTYRGNNSFHKDRDKELAAHATVKPIDLVADAIRDCSHNGGIVLDAFGGSGTTLLAAERTHRRARLIELEPRYCDVTIRRWQEMTGQEAVLVATGDSFDDVRIARDIDADQGEDEE